MNKKILTVYLSAVVAMILYFIIGYIRLEIIIHTPEDVVILDSFDYLGQTSVFTERKIDNAQKIHRYATEISSDDLEGIGQYWSLIVTRLRGNWHEVYFNGHHIGEIGSRENISNHVWNDVYQFTIDETYIQEVNTLTFETYSEYKIGFGNTPILIANRTVAHDLFKRLKRFHSGFYIIAITSVLTLAFVEMLLFAFTKYYGKSYSMMPMSIFAIGLYLFDYSIISYSPISPLLFKKIIIMMLYVSVFIQNIALTKLYEKAYILRYGIFTLVFSLISFIFIQDLVTFSNVYRITNLLLLINVLIWFVESILKHLKYKETHFLMMAVATGLLLVPGTIDVVVLALNKGQNLRLTIYGILFYSMAILLTSMIHYIDHQKQLYHHSEALKLETVRLEKALVTDDLTSLGNHRGFYEAFRYNTQIKNKKIAILFMDIDKFRAINHTLGYAVGDEIIKRLATIISGFAQSPKHVYRYGGEEFVMLCDEALYSQPQVLAESIRRKVLADQVLTGLSGFYSVTISIGIAAYPDDAVDLKMVLRKAEKATEYAKFSGRNRVVNYHRGIEAKLESVAQQQLKHNLLSDFVLTLAAAIDLKDVYTGKHSEEVSRFALMIADEMGLDDDTKSTLKMGSLLHDLGKIAMPDAILKKNGKLSESEYEEVKAHTLLGSKLIEEIIDDPLVIACVRNHHEWYDGTGYPDGFKGEGIPLLARIVGVADAYHAMISTRSYRQSMDKSEAIEQLSIHQGSQFDPHIVETFIRVIGD